LPNVGERSGILPHPLHHEVSLVLADEIERGRLRRGTPLPPERALCEQLGVSRVTLRKALSTLAEQGLLSPSHGRAWFVTDSTLGELPNLLQSLTEQAEARGLKAASRMMRATVRGTSLDEADQLEVAPGTPLFEMHRLRLLDGLPVAVDHVRIPLDVCPALATADFGAVSLYQTLEAHGVMLYRCDFVIQAMSADAALAEALEVPLATPLLLAIGTAFGERERPIELSQVHFIGERYRFRASLYRNHSPHRPSRAKGNRS
jgi:GntR family transcriptional regulator